MWARAHTDIDTHTHTWWWWPPPSPPPPPPPHTNKRKTQAGFCVIGSCDHPADSYRVHRYGGSPFLSHWILTCHHQGSQTNIHPPLQFLREEINKDTYTKKMYCFICPQYMGLFTQQRIFNEKFGFRYQYAQWFPVPVCPMVSGTSMPNGFWYQYAQCCFLVPVMPNGLWYQYVQWFLVLVCPMVSGTSMPSNAFWYQYAQWFVVPVCPMVCSNSIPNGFW